MRTLGFCDGVKSDEIYGWAWHPEAPDVPVDVDIWLDDIVIASTTATLYRGDLRAAGIGHGRYGWRVAVPKQAECHEGLRLVVRSRNGEILAHGEVQYHPDAPLADLRDPELQRFVGAVLSDAGKATAPPEKMRPPSPVTHFLLSDAGPADARQLGDAEYSYGFVQRGFRPVLETLGRVHMPASEAAAQALADEALAAGQACVRLFFGPPHRAPLPVPVIPVVAWEFPTIPDRSWDGEARHDWTFVLRQMGRAITLSEASAVAVRAALGTEFPVVAIPTPIWDRRPSMQTLAPPSDPVELAIDGFVLDTRGRRFDPVEPIPSVPDPACGAPERAFSDTVTLDGFVATAVLAPKDGRKNWTDLLTAFVAALGDREDATLVFKMIARDPGQWWWELHELLGKQRPFSCRIVVLHGYLEEAQYARLVQATHWVVNASKAEGQCLPLLEFLCAGRPAIAPRHSAMSDYIDETDALIVVTSEEYCGWPHDPANRMTTVRHRIDWTSLRDRFAEAYTECRERPETYRMRGEAARRRMRDFCSDAAVAARLDSFLGLGLGLADRPSPPSPLLAAETMR